MEGWRQRRPGSNEKNPLGKKRKTGLTLTGLLMEGLGFGYRQRGNAVGRTQRLDQLSLKVRRPYARRYKKYPMKQTPMR